MIPALRTWTARRAGVGLTNHDRIKHNTENKLTVIGVGLCKYSIVVTTGFLVYNIS